MIYDFYYLNPKTRTIIILEPLADQIRIVTDKYNLQLDDPNDQGLLSIYIEHNSACHIHNFSSKLNRNEFIIGKHNPIYPFFENKIKIVQQKGITDVYVGENESRLKIGTTDYIDVNKTVTNNIYHAPPFIHMSDLKYIVNNKELREYLKLQTDLEIFEKIISSLIRELPNRLICNSNNLDQSRTYNHIGHISLRTPVKQYIHYMKYSILP